ncbi:MAG: S8 family serine peptidase [Nocardioidaceae bacterium]
MAVLLALAPLAYADDASPAPTAADPVPPAGHELRGERTVTLITGDQVRLTYTGQVAPQVRVVSSSPGGYNVRTEGDDVYVIPDVAAAALASDRVDRALFNVTSLVEQGYDDARVDQIPLIAVYDDTLRSAPPAPSGAKRTDALPSINAAALRADKDHAREVWDALTPRSAPAGRHLEKLWLDAKVEATLDQSVPFVGAPEAWAAGLDGTGAKVAVLDSGIDAEHPDLADSVVASENFTDSPDVYDRHGHGTHVASTVAGSGAASAGAHRGVAPGADLLVGKVLDDFGSGELSWIIAGMEWAVAQEADVVNMSIGQSEATGCDDLMAQSLNDLSASSDTLFVVAAGNLGGPADNVTSPGCAAAALTVGAVDLDAETAWFSSRGPVPVSRAVKPDIAAPGMAITAARAGGRDDRAYVDSDGTSMAAPHVAGAAAILSQQHAGWDGEQIKAALQSAVRAESAGSIYEQGAGVLDVAAAVDQSVVGPSTIDLGSFAWPHEATDATRSDVTYRNAGSADVELSVAADTRGQDGTPLPKGTITLGATRLVVPAGGTATLPVTFDPSARLTHAQYGAIGVRLVASGAGQTVVTPLGAYVEPQHVDVTFRVIAHDGSPATGSSSLDVFDLDAITAQRIQLRGDEVTLHLRAGTYSLASTVITTEPGNFRPSTVALLSEPEIALTSDRTITLDGRQAMRMEVRTDRPTDLHSGSVSYVRSVGGYYLSNSRVFGDTLDSLYLGRTDQARRGKFEVLETWLRTSPEGTAEPYDYGLAYAHQGRVGGSPWRVADHHRLATVDSRYYAPGAADTYVEYFDIFRPLIGTYLPLGDIRDVDAPGALTHYLTPSRDLPIEQSVIHPDGTRWVWGQRMISPPKTRQPGSRTTESWFKTGLRPGVASSPLLGGRYDSAARDGDVIRTHLPSWSDTEPSHYSWGTLTGPSTGMELFVDGESLGRDHWFGDGAWSVPSDARDYELVYDLVRFTRSFSTWTAPEKVQTRWRFRSAHTDGEQPLPLLFPDYDLEVDQWNRAPATAAYDLRIGVEATPGYARADIADATAWVSYDDGATWTEAPTRTSGDDLVATVDNRPASGGHVSFKVELADVNGVGVTQQVDRLYAVP